MKIEAKLISEAQSRKGDAVDLFVAKENGKLYYKDQNGILVNFVDESKLSASTVTTPTDVVMFDKTNPSDNTATFTPNTPTTINTLYVSSVNSSTWTYNGSSYQTYVAPVTTGNTPFYLLGTTVDAGSNKTAAIQHLGPLRATTFTGDGLNITGINAANLAIGTIAPIRMGSGTANSTTFLRGDNTWAAAGLQYFTEAQNSSVPNATVKVDSLTAVANTTNADFSIVPKGTGAFTLAIPDNTTVGGNKRGANAVDLQTYRTINTQVASGDYSFSAGARNTAAQTYSVALGVNNNVSAGFLCIGANNLANGFYSVAIGDSNTSTGSWAITLGRSNTTTGQDAITLGGVSNSASGQYSFVGGGTNNTASAQYSIAMGQSAIASGLYSIAIGSGGSTASANTSIVLGYGSISNNTSSIAIGYGVTASGAYSTVAGGQNNTASGQYSFVAGYNCLASGLGNVSIGYSNTVSNNLAYAFGSSCNATNANALAMGNRAKATGDSAICISSYFYADSFASGANSVMIGTGTVSGGSAQAFGNQVTADASFSTAFGYGANTFGIAGKISYSSYNITSSGDVQDGNLRLIGRTTDATPKTLNTINTTLINTGTQLTLQNQQLIAFEGKVTGKQSGSTNVGVWKIDGVIVRGANAGSTTLVVNNVTLITNASAWGIPVMSADTTNGCLSVQVTGLAGTNIQWKVSINTVENLYL